jgi:hypothetical protein
MSHEKYPNPIPWWDKSIPILLVYLVVHPTNPNWLLSGVITHLFCQPVTKPNDSPRIAITKRPSEPESENKELETS